MKFNAKKSQSVVLKNGKPSDRFKFKIACEAIPNEKDQPMKCLCKFFNRSSTDTNNVKTIGGQLDQWLGSINKSELSGKYGVTSMSYYLESFGL